MVLAVLLIACAVAFYFLFIDGRPPARRPHLVRLPAYAPPPLRGFPTVNAAMLMYVLGMVDIVDIAGEIPIPDGVTFRPDVEYGRVGDRPLLLDLYLPEAAEESHPAIIFIHGGGWVDGDKRDYRFYAVRFAARGYVVASIGYRFAQEARFPGCLEDAKCAVRWLRANAPELGVDAERIAVVGGSAGGYLAMMVGYAPDDPCLEGAGGHAGVSSAVAAVVNAYGPTDLTTDYARNHPTVTRFLGKRYEDAPDLYALASPIHHVTANAPPTLILHGTIDNIVPVEQADMLAEKFQRLGVPYWYDRADGFPHTMDLIAPVAVRNEFLMHAFLQEHFYGRPPEEAAPLPPPAFARLETLLGRASDIAWGPPMLVLLCGTHLFLTIRLRLIQRFIGKAIRLSLVRSGEGRGDISHFGALTTALAATVGTGNIVGVATAVAAGGPGAVLWMWLTGVFGIATKYSEALLGVKYRVMTPQGMAGGPMYALERGLGCRWLGVLFALFTVIASFGIGNMVQANAVAGLLQDTLRIPPGLSGIVLAVLTALVVLGGIRSIARVSEKLVPFMALLYAGGCVVLLLVHISTLPATVMLILRSAFSGHAAFGGFLGAGVREAMRYGVARGLFSNESGLGSAPIVAAAAQTRNPVRQALVSSTGTFWDTVVICLMTGLVIVNSGAWTEGLRGAALTHKAFSAFPYIGPFVLTSGLLTFVYSTILGWSYYGEKACEYLVGTRATVPYRCLWVLMVFVGATVSLPIVWSFSDIANALMAVPNLIALLLLSGVIVAETRRYLWEGRIEEDEQDS